MEPHNGAANPTWVIIIPRLQHSVDFLDALPGPMAQAFAFRAFGAEHLSTTQ
jgi:hypothetical protein